MKKIFKTLRMAWLKAIRYRLNGCGPGSYIGSRVRIRPNAVTIGRDSFIGPESWLSSELKIGNWVMLAGRVAVVGGDHLTDIVGTPMIHADRGQNQPVIIEDDVWVGYGVVIMHGVRIGEGAVIAAGAVVVEDVEAFTVVGGVPAKYLKRRFDQTEAIEHRNSLEARRRACKI